MQHLPFRVLTLIHKPHLPPHRHPTLHHRFLHLHLPDGAYRSRPRQRVGHSILFKILEQTLPSGRVSREILVEETDASWLHPTQSLWSSSSMASSDISVTDGDTHWTMIECAPISPTTGGLGLELRRSGPVFEYSDPEPRTNHRTGAPTSPPPTSGTCSGNGDADPGPDLAGGLVPELHH